MAIYIDPSSWPAHGTHFSHLISDHSLEELHAIAARAGISERAFDRDHYDIPLRRYSDLVRLGAIPVDGGQLTRRLIASGLRVPARQRSESLETALLLRWGTLLPQEHELGRELLARWSEKHRHYHSRTHLLGILEALQTLEPNPPRSVLLAAWYHDAVYRGVAGQDEADSANLAVSQLSGKITDAELDEVRRLILLTASHRPEPSDADGALLCDADLAILGSSDAEYARYLAAVREDFRHVCDADFTVGRTAVVRGLLALDPLYRTPVAQQLWSENARRNLTNELA